MVILLLSLIVFQISKPTEMAEKRKLFLKLIGCGITVIFCTILVISMNEGPNIDSHAFEELTFLSSWITVEVIVGLALPEIFITSYASLKKFFARLISIPIDRLIAIMNGFKRIALHKNRIHTNNKVLKRLNKTLEQFLFGL